MAAQVIQERMIKAQIAQLRMTQVKRMNESRRKEALSTGRVFCNNNKQILMTADTWRELCLPGHWIIEAVILRWGELSARLGKAQAVGISEVVEPLLATPNIERETDQARKVYSDQQNMECVWTGKSLSRGFEVNHVIPYSLWRNNQQRNLLPAAKDANQKSLIRFRQRPCCLRGGTLWSVAGN